MHQWLTIVILSIVEAIRRLWRNFTGRKPVPVKVRARRTMLEPTSPSLSRLLLNGQLVVPQWRDRR